MGKIEISIVVPVYRAEKFIRQTMDLVRGQSFKNWEMILVVDGCEDSSAKIIEDYIKTHQENRMILYVQEGNKGAAAARNLGVDKASGRYIAYLDADDLWDAMKLEKQLAFMKEKKCGFSFMNYEFANEEGISQAKYVIVPEKITYKEALKNTTIFTSTVMLDTDIIPKEFIHMPLVKSEDTALWWKLLKLGFEAYGIKENYVLYRRPAKSLSSNKLEAIRRIWNLYRKQEGLGIMYSCYNFCFWAYHAVLRRI